MAVNSTGSLTNNGGHIQVGPEFSPSSLFAASEVGVWYDPSDFSTLYQNTNGTSPVTAVEQPVGLMLDKSKGLTLGSELVTNGDFSSGLTGWTQYSGVPADIDTSSGSAVLTRGATNTAAYQDITTQAGKSYALTADVTVLSGSGGNVALNVWNGAFSTIISNNSAPMTTSTTIIFRALGTLSRVAIYVQASGTSASFDNISIKELPGNHAVAANNGTARPVLRSRYNLLTYSEQFDNAAWTKLNSTITANATAAPDGTTTADLITHTSTSNPEINQTATVVSGAQYTISVYVKYVDSQWFRIRAAGAIVASAWFDIQNGSTGTSTFSAVSMTNVGDGWYRITATGTTSTTSLTVAFNLSLADNSSVEVIGSADIWGAQLVANSVFPSNTYQRIAAATDYDTDATKFPPYLAFTTDDAMSTASIDFSATDEMTVFAGVTKNSDAAAALICELSVSSASNNNTFAIFAPNTGATYTFRSRGTAPTLTTTPSSFAAPISNVVAGIGDISGDVSIIRVDGVQEASESTDQGTGNFGNYPLYIGARGGSSLFFNGSLYSLIVRGKTSTFDEIRTTELWIAQKVGL